MYQLQHFWKTTDPILQQALGNSSSPAERIVYNTDLRQENTYNVEVNVRNEQLTVNEIDSVKFVPSQCTWFEVKNSDSYSGKFTSQVPPGDSELVFVLEQKRVPLLNCDEFNFYDQFDSLEFEYFLNNGVDYINDIPQANYTVSKGANSTITVTIPKD